jgi:uncharacterized protein involved in response to NO
MLIQINQSIPTNAKQFSLFNLGFRPFFLGASIFAVVSIVAWMRVYFSQSTLSMTNITVSQWHSHEMVYGYGMAVLAGFLLTAVKNWTGIPTLFGKQLMVLFGLWCAARVAFLFGTTLLAWAAVADLLFGMMFIIAIAIPIIKAKQWIQLAVVAKVTLLWVGNLVFYLGCFGVLTNGMTYAINGAILLFVSLILMIGRRVIPFFIERGVANPAVGNNVQLKQYRWLDISILVVFSVLFVNAIFMQIPYLTSTSAWVLFGLNGFRLFNWHTAGLWRVPLLWSLYLSAWLINLGFFFYGLQATQVNLSILTLHIFAVGGIGLMTLSMMSRVALGHTGRDIRKPSRWLGIVFFSLVCSAIFRAIIPMFTTQLYMYLILVAAILWCLSFTVFVWIYAPILIKPRVDGAFG